MSVVARLTDRLRPWAAPPPAGQAGVPIVVIGAGPAGLATAALLGRAGRATTVVDRSETAGGSWPTRYDSLRLNTVRWMSDLPGMRMERRLGRWVRRDEIVDYLDRYAAHHHLDVRRPVDARRVDHDAHGWFVELDDGPMRASGVVVATGHSRRAVIPAEVSPDRFGGRVMHSSAYRRPGDHLGRRVLVVGAGSSGGEICVDLARAGVDVTWSVRTAPQLFPRELLGVPSTPFAPPADLLPDRALDRLAPRLERLVYGTRDYLPDPPAPMTELLARCKEPMTADGIVELVRSNRVGVVAAVDELDRHGARLTDGGRVDVDDVILATGYRPGLDGLVGHLDVLDADGRPRATVPRPGLGFVGYRIPFTGTLWAIEDDARDVARALAH